MTFDRLVRRELRTKYRWDFRSRTLQDEERLVTPRDVILLKLERGARNPATGELMSFGGRR